MFVVTWFDLKVCTVGRTLAVISVTTQWMVGIRVYSISMNEFWDCAEYCMEFSLGKLLNLNSHWSNFSIFCYDSLTLGSLG